VQKTNNEQIEFLRNQINELQKPQVVTKTPNSDIGNVQGRRPN